MSSYIEHDGTPPLCPAPDPKPTKPRHAIPAGAVDCHCHTFEDQTKYPLYPGRSYTPPLCTLQNYLDMCAAIGIERTVQVNASVYGTDNSVTLDLIRTLGHRKARGVAGLSLDAKPDHLERLHEGGMRGVRLSTHVKGYGGMELIKAMAAVVKPFGWHLQVHVANSSEIAEHEKELMAAPVPLVFDHMVSTRGSEGVGAPGFQALLRLLKQRDDCWVKISSWYRRSDNGPPDYSDMKALAQALVDARPDRCVFGTNWPHPVWHGDMPNDGDLISMFCDWITDPEARRKVLSANPARLYWGE
jgi:2-pyrone-4,6-dicarboxylate lactonase